MITKISIENFKSIYKLESELGRFNILIGENGCGKSNILEAISYGVATSQDKLDNEYLGLRGIRITEPQFMTSAFESQNTDSIIIGFAINDEYLGFQIKSNNKYFSTSTIPFDKKINEYPPDNININLPEEFLKNEMAMKTLKDIFKTINIPEEKIYFNLNEREDIKKIEFSKSSKTEEKIKKVITGFTFYCPEESALRTFRDDIQMLPLGRKGEGLFKYLKDLSKTEEGQETLKEIKENLCLLDWFDNIDIPIGTMSGDYTVHIKDRYIDETLEYFDQRSTNEGFLYLLFYLTLFISKDTPSFFAIDNIESSFNPKLCTKVIKVLIDLAKKHNKQVIITTHSPFVLDGMDLSDDEQKLFVVRRNDEGHTKMKEVEYKQERKKKLSDLWMSGVIGGLPDNF